MKKSLVVGFGNSYRHDDGVGRVVVNRVRERLGRPPLDANDDGFGDLGHTVDTVVLHQLSPDLGQELKPYELIIFVDAHTDTLDEEICVAHLKAEHKTPFVYHQTHPATVLEVAEQLHGEAPEGYVVSIRGYDFDFGEGLSEKTEALVEPAVEKVMGFIEEGAPADA